MVHSVAESDSRRARGGPFVAHSRHRHASSSRRRPRMSSTRVILPVVGVLTLGTAGIAAAVHYPSATASVAGAASPDLFAASVENGQAPDRISRSAERAPIPNVAAVEDKIEGLRYAVKPLEVHSASKSS